MRFLLGLALAVVLTPAARRLGLVLGLVDRPGQDELKVHHEPIPVLGGLAVLVSVLIALAALGPWLPAMVAGGFGLAFLAGSLDDLVSLRPLARLALLAAAGGLIALGGGRTWPLGAVGVAGVVALVMVCANSVNLMDGLDGLVGGLAAIAALAMAIVLVHAGRPGSGALGFALCGALTGFLVWNRPPARIFLGNGGAYVVGAMLAVLAARISTVLEVRGLFVAFGCLAVFAAELVVTVVRRSLARAPLAGGDRLHLYDRLAGRVGGGTPAALMFWGLGALAGAMGFLLSLAPTAVGVIMAAVVLAAAVAEGIRSARRSLRSVRDHGGG